MLSLCLGVNIVGRLWENVESWWVVLVADSAAMLRTVALFWEEEGRRIDSLWQWGGGGAYDFQRSEI